jgi:four helix bundle protein
LGVRDWKLEEAKRMKSYKELKVWQKAINLVTLVYQLSRTFPKEEQYGLTAQMRRAAVSIPSNIAEGWGRNSTKEYIQFLTIARASLMELETQLIIAEKLKYLQLQQLENAAPEIETVGKMLNALITRLKNRG